MCLLVKPEYIFMSWRTKGNILKLYLGSAKSEPVTAACSLFGVCVSTTLASSQYNHDFRNHFKEGHDDPVVETLRLDQSGSVPGSFRKYSHGQIISSVCLPHEADDVSSVWPVYLNHIEQIGFHITRMKRVDVIHICACQNPFQKVRFCPFQWA